METIFLNLSTVEKNMEAFQDIVSFYYSPQVNASISKTSDL